MKESNTQKLIQLALSDAGYLFWRNESAGAWAGQVIYQDAETVTLRNPRFVSVGLCTGSSDLIGIGPGGLFAAIEVKASRGRVADDQLRFIDAVNGCGGLAGIARSVDDAMDIINGK